MKIQYQDKIMEVNQPITIQELLAEEISKSKHTVVGAIFNNEYANLEYRIEEDGEVQLIDIASKEGMKIYRRTLIYILGKAFEKICPDEKIFVNYQLTNSMFCDIENFEITDEFIKQLTDRKSVV